MSGIVGIFYPGMAKPIDPARIVAMSDAVAHRGRDGSGVWCVAGLGLGHRRLATIDVAGGVQPMALPDQRLAVVLDGAIYNFRAVRAELEGQGACFTTESDTEVLLHGWRAWGPDLLPRLDGVFAFALYDADRQSLFLARDRLGAKPLHIAELTDGAIAFSSELKGLLAHPMFRRAADIRAVEDYLGLGYVPDDACLVAGVEKLAAGHFLLVQRGRARGRAVRWWDVDFSRRAPGRTRDLKVELLERMRVAVRRHMVADVTLGALLPDSLEGEGMVALMAASSKTAVQTCTLGDAPHEGREAFARTVARRFATRHRDGRAVFEPGAVLDTLTNAFDEPIADGAAAMAYTWSAFARETMAVALSAEGLDAVWAGHRRIRAFVAEERVRALMPADLRARLLGGFATVYPEAQWVPQPLRARPLLHALAGDGAAAYAQRLAVTAPAIRAGLFTDAARQALAGYHAETRIIAAMRAAPARSSIDRAQYADIRHRLPGSQLTMLDRSGMMAGLEVRAPWLDHQLVEFVASLPESLRLRGQGRWLMRKAWGPWLPRTLPQGTAGAVALPLADWFRTTLADAAAALPRSPVLQQTGWFERRAFVRLAEDHRTGRADHGALLWQLLVLDRAMTRLFG